MVSVPILAGALIRFPFGLLAGARGSRAAR